MVKGPKRERLHEHHKNLFALLPWAAPNGLSPSATLALVGLRYTNIGLITCRDWNPDLVNKIESGLSFLREEGNIGPLHFSLNRGCPGPGSTCDSSPQHQNLGTVLWPLLDSVLYGVALYLLLCFRVHFFFRVKALDFK